MSVQRNVDITVSNRGIDVGVAEDAAGWNDAVARSGPGTVFHHHAFLEVVSEHNGATMYPLVGYKGQELVGVFPVFERTYGGITTVFSPPPNMGLSQLGPVLPGLDRLKARTAEKRTRRFIEGCLDWLDRAVDPNYVHVRTTPWFDDNRPFAWNGFDLTPRYTYVVDLRPGTEAVMESFSADARNNVRTTPDGAYVIEQVDLDGIDGIIDHLDRRYDEQNVRYSLDRSLVVDLYRQLPEGCVRPYVCTVDGEYAGGILVLDDGQTVYRWQGGAKPYRDVDVPVNDLLDWRIMADAIERGRTRYDLVGANTPHLCEYKSKFGADLVTYTSAERSSLLVQLASRLYYKFR